MKSANRGISFPAPCSRAAVTCSISTLFLSLSLSLFQGTMTNCMFLVCLPSGSRILQTLVTRVCSLPSRSSFLPSSSFLLFVLHLSSPLLKPFLLISHSPPLSNSSSCHSLFVQPVPHSSSLSPTLPLSLSPLSPPPSLSLLSFFPRSTSPSYVTKLLNNISHSCFRQNPQ